MSLPCPKCGYDLRAVSSERCPECGASLSLLDATDHRAATSRKSRVLLILVAGAAILGLIGLLAWFMTKLEF